MEDGNVALEQSQCPREKLVLALQESGAICSPHIAHAFLHVPREAFVSAFYQRETEPGMNWTRCTASEIDAEPWLDLIYQDEPLVTKLDERKWPISSSSAPSLMAHMPEALEIQPGQRVLEIGTGTGYNAALLACLTGDPTLVTTIDIDPHLTEAAARILHQIVGPVRVETGDGRLGIPGQSYDRIILTASTSSLSSAWYQQLAPGGRLIAELEGSLQARSGLLVQKERQQAHGRVLGQSWYFMALRTEGEAATHPLLSREQTRSLLAEPAVEHLEIDAQEPLVAALAEPSFRWFLQWWWPTRTLRLVNILAPQRPLLHISDEQQRTILQLGKQGERWTGQQHGTLPLWQMVQQAYEQYMRREPQPEDFEVSWNDEHAFLHLPSSSPLCDLSSNMEETCTRKPI